jgi:GH43 family beta-xylosidase
MKINNLVPGHNSFTVSEDGTKDLLVYHCRNYTELKGDPLSDPKRHTRIEVINWNERWNTRFWSTFT